MQQNKIKLKIRLLTFVMEKDLVKVWKQQLVYQALLIMLTLKIWNIQVTKPRGWLPLIEGETNTKRSIESDLKLDVMFVKNNKPHVTSARKSIDQDTSDQDITLVLLKAAPAILLHVAPIHHIIMHQLDQIKFVRR